MKLSQTITAALLASALFFTVSACDKDDPLEEAGEEMDEALEKSGDSIEDAGDAIEDSTDDY